MPSSGLYSLVVGSFGLFLLGCGSSGAPKHVVKGSVTNAGKVIPIKQTETKSGGWLRVWLMTTEPGKVDSTYEARINFETGEFTIDGPDGRGVPEGKYKVCVQWKEKGPLDRDSLNDRFSEMNSKIVRDIPPPDGELKIDVSKPGG